MKKYTINQFRAQYPNDDICLDTIFKLRYTAMPCCPCCSQATTFKRIKGRRAYQCSDKDCQYQLYPTAGTVFEKTRTSLVDWFYAIYLMTSTRNGVAAKELQRQLGVTYKCAWRIGHQLRELMAARDKATTPEKLSGHVEIDETWVGGKIKGKNRPKTDGKTVVMGLVQRGGAFKGHVVDDSK